MKQKNKVGIMLVLCVLLVSGFATAISSVKENIDDWEVTIDVSETSGKHDYIMFGEKSDASDLVDQYDVPKCPAPPGGYIYIWINAPHLPFPYSTAWFEYRSLPKVATNWEIKVLWVPQGCDSTIATLTWNTDNFGYYRVVRLFDSNGNFIANMKEDSSYSFQMEPYDLASFEVRCNRNILRQHLL